MFCAISGVVPSTPVVSQKSGHLFEKRLVLQQLEQSGGKCPVTGQDLAPSDLVEVRVAAAGSAAPRLAASSSSATTAGASIPALLDTFREEWDATVLEAHTLRQQLLDVRQQLSLALYEKDAARRVIAKLLKEREELKKMFVGGAGAAVSAPSGIPGNSTAASSDEDVTQASLDAATKKLTEMRSARKKPEGWAANNIVASFEEIASKTPHKSTAKGVLSLARHPHEPILLSGGADGQAKLMNTKTYKVLGTLSGHDGPVNCVAFTMGDMQEGASSPQPLTGSADGTVRLWDAAVSKKVECRATLEGHTGGVTALSAHGLLPFALSSSHEDGSWRTWDLTTGKTVHQNLNGVQVAALHPDGVLALGGVAELDGDRNVVVMWDIRESSGKVVAGKFGRHEGDVVSCVALSQNGYHAATGSRDGIVNMWDMRKAGTDGALMATFSVDRCAHNLAYDHYGKYIAACGDSGLDVYAVKKWSAPLLSLRPTSGKKRKKAGGDADTVTIRAACWARNATWLATGSMDRTVKFYGSK